MLKVVGIIGYKNSGKTTLARALARELTSRGHEVAVVKHTSHHLDLPGKDTTTLGEAVGQVGFISLQESGVFWKRPLSLENIIPYLEADIILVEGFKTEKTFPKIVCLRGEPDDRDLFDGLAICAILPPPAPGGAGGGSNPSPSQGVAGGGSNPPPAPGGAGGGSNPPPVSGVAGGGSNPPPVSGGAGGGFNPPPAPGGDGGGSNLPLLGQDEVGRIADLVEEKAFKLPNLDCGGCGHETCYDMAREIVAATGSVEDCVSLQPATEVRIDGQPMPMNSFISSIVRNTILGLLSPLKGFKKGKIEISI